MQHTYGYDCKLQKVPEDIVEEVLEIPAKFRDGGQDARVDIARVIDLVHHVSVDVNNNASNARKQTRTS